MQHVTAIPIISIGNKHRPGNDHDGQRVASSECAPISVDSTIFLPEEIAVTGAAGEVVGLVTALTRDAIDTLVD